MNKRELEKYIENYIQSLLSKIDPVYHKEVEHSLRNFIQLLLNCK